MTAERQRPIPGDRSPENLALVFRNFGQYEAPQLEAHLYEALCPAIAEDAELLEVLASVPASQPPPNILFGAVHYLLFEDDTAPLRRFYRDLGGETAPSEAFPEFRSYVLEHRAEIEVLLSSRRVQTNVIQRCTALLPAFATVAGRADGRPLALIEVGASAGLNLLWDRYSYRYETDGREVAIWGGTGASVQLSCEVHGQATPPTPGELNVAWRAGLELEPVDVEDADAVRWLRALIWPEHVERHERLAAAIEVARAEPPRLVEGDATVDLPSLMAEAPADAVLCVFATHALYQIPRDGREQMFEAMRTTSEERPIAFITIEGTGIDHSEAFLHWYEDGERSVTHLANCNPHGRWLEWLDATS